MQYRFLGRSGLQVSTIGIGANQFGGPVDAAGTAAILDACLESGINTIDTSDSYGRGVSEQYIGPAIKAKRDEWVLMTKFYSPLAEGPNRSGSSRGYIRKAVEASLKRLGTDYIDVWQLHNVRGDHLREDALWMFLDKVRASGKVRSIGVALGPAIGWLDEGLYSLRDRPVDTVQMIYNALELDPGRELIAAARETGRSLLVRVPHSSGMLEGKYDANTTFDANDHRSHRPKAWLTNGLQKIQQLDFLTNGTERTLGQAALRYVLHDPTVVSALPNIYNLDQVDEFCGASDVADITTDEAARIQALFETNYGLPREVEQAVARP